MRYDAVAFVGEERLERGDKFGGFHVCGGCGEKGCCVARAEIADGHVWRVAGLADGGADAFLGLAGNAVLVCLAVDNERNHTP